MRKVGGWIFMTQLSNFSPFCFYCHNKIVFTFQIALWNIDEMNFKCVIRGCCLLSILRRKSAISVTLESPWGKPPMCRGFILRNSTRLLNFARFRSLTPSLTLSAGAPESWCYWVSQFYGIVLPLFRRLTTNILWRYVGTHWEGFRHVKVMDKSLA